MESPTPPPDSEPQVSRVSPKSIRSPDQYVISYNFEQGSSRNLTHNVLIGMSLNEPPKTKSKGQMPSHLKHNKTSMHTLLSRSKFVPRPPTNAATPNSNKKRYSRNHNTNTHPTVLSRFNDQTDSPSEQRRSEEASNPSRKEIQDQQMMQIERDVRKQQPEAFKRGHAHKHSNNGTEVIPFQSSVDPSFTQQQQQAQSTRLNQHQHQCSRDHSHNSRTQHRSTHQASESAKRQGGSHQHTTGKQRSSMFQQVPDQFKEKEGGKEHTIKRRSNLPSINQPGRNKPSVRNNEVKEDRSSQQVSQAKLRTGAERGERSSSSRPQANNRKVSTQRQGYGGQQDPKEVFKTQDRSLSKAKFNQFNSEGGQSDLSNDRVEQVNEPSEMSQNQEEQGTTKLPQKNETTQNFHKPTRQTRNNSFSPPMKTDTFQRNKENRQNKRVDNNRNTSQRTVNRGNKQEERNQEADKTRNQTRLGRTKNQEDDPKIKGYRVQQQRSGTNTNDKIKRSSVASSSIGKEPRLRVNKPLQDQSERRQRNVSQGREPSQANLQRNNRRNRNIEQNSVSTEQNSKVGNPKGRDSLNSTIKSTVPRQSKTKDRNFKNWRDSERGKIEKEKKQHQRRRSSRENQQKDKSRPKKSEFSSRSKHQSAVVDLDRQDDDKYGLAAVKNTIVKRQRQKSMMKMKNQSPVQNEGTGLMRNEDSQIIDSSMSQSNESLLDSHRKGSEAQQMAQHNKSLSKISSIDNDPEQQMTRQLQISGSLRHDKAQEESADVVPLTTTPQPKHKETDGLEQLLIAAEDGPSPIKAEGTGRSNIVKEHSEKPLDKIREETEKNSSDDGHSRTPIKNGKPSPTHSRHRSESLQRSNSKGSAKSAKSQKSNGHSSKVAETSPRNSRGKPAGALIATGPERVRTEGSQPESHSPLKPAGKKVSSFHRPSSRDKPSSPEPLDKINSAEDQDMIEMPQNSRINFQIPEESKIMKRNPSMHSFKNADKSEDFFENNLRDLSKANDTANHSLNMTQYQSFDQDLNNYRRAPIVTFIYGCSDIDSFEPSNTRISVQLAEDEKKEGLVNEAIDLLLEVDRWIVQRIFEPYQDLEGKYGVWLYCVGQWTLFKQRPSNDFRQIIKQGVKEAIQRTSLLVTLDNVLRLISGVRIMRIKSTKKRIMSQLDFSTRKGHVIKAVTKSQSKWGGRMIEVAKVETSRPGQKVLQLKTNEGLIWVTEDKFKDIFDCFLVICARRSHFWTTQAVDTAPNRRAVVKVHSHAPAQGSVTLFYPSKQSASLYLYKQTDTKVLKLMGKIQDKPNEDFKIYFEFKLHGTYHIFLEAPQPCLMAMQSTVKVTLRQIEYVSRDSLKNQQCQYLELKKQKSLDKPTIRQTMRQDEDDALNKLRQTFVRMIVGK